MKPEIYVSTDIETDGQVAGISNMLSLGSVAYDSDGNHLADFYMKIARQPEFTAEESTMTWWTGFPKEFQEATTDAAPPKEAMTVYWKWLEELPGAPVFVGTPAAWDFSFVWYYLNRYAGGCPFSHRALDVRTYAMALFGTRFLGDDKDPNQRNAKTMFKQFNTYKNPCPHHALEDAIEQGTIFVNMLKYRRRMELGKDILTRLWSFL